MLHYDPYDRELMKNPWQTYRRLRDEAPAYYMEKYDAWVLSRFEDILFQAANRDERVFQRPVEFDVERTIRQQIAFGTGIHVCLGMHVARLESRMMLEWLLNQAADYTIDTARAERGLLAGMHGFRRLPIRVKA